MKKCNNEFFGLETLVDYGDCEHCPFKEKSKCREVQEKILESTRKFYNQYLCFMDPEDRKKLTDKEKESLFIAFRRGKVKRWFRKLGVKLA